MAVNERAYGHFPAAFDPLAGVLEGVEGDFFAQGHRLGVVRPEEVMAPVRFRCLSAVLSQIENWNRAAADGREPRKRTHTTERLKY